MRIHTKAMPSDIYQPSYRDADPAMPTIGMSRDADPGDVLWMLGHLAGFAFYVTLRSTGERFTADLVAVTDHGVTFIDHSDETSSRTVPLTDLASLNFA